MPPVTPQPNSQSPQPSGDAVWISREEYDRLRTSQAPTVTVVPTWETGSTRALANRRRWQVVLGVLLAIGLFISVAAGSFANIFLVGAIVIFAIVSLNDLRSERNVKTMTGGIVQPAVSKRNPYKILAIVLLCITVLPPLVMVGFFLLLLTLGGGHMGS